MEKSKNMMWKVITTNAEKGEYWKERNVIPTEQGCMNLLSMYPHYRRQCMKGFGGAFTEAAGYCYAKLSPDKKKQFIRDYFTEEGLNYNVGRTHINSCDFSLGNYAAVTNPEDTDFTSMNLEREKQYILPLIGDAMKAKGETIDLLLSPWSPPAFMKTNGEMNHGGKLKPEYRFAWARYIASYIKKMQEEGLSVRYLTVQNEPEAVQTWDSCVYHAEEEMAFVRDCLGPVLEQEGLEDIKILVWDHNKEIVFDRASSILRDEKAASYIYGIGVHWYTGDHFQGLSMVRETYPDKELFFTEGCVEYSRFQDSGEVAKGEMYAHDMIGNFNHGVSAFFDWNLMLDAAGGPNHVGNFCAAPVMATEDGCSFEKRLSYYYIGHFSRYIKKGAYQVPVTTYCGNLDVTGFVNPDGERIMIILNCQEKCIPAVIRENGTGIALDVAPHSIVTVCYHP